MEPTRTYSWRLRLLISITLILLFSFILSPSVSVNEGVQERTRTLGSRPPGCVNRCMNCQPCRATLVIPPHHKNKIIDYRSQSSHREDDCYYLLSWKCKCGDKLFQP
ncbi:unnamed protein product [Lactuca virosa]|uniref:Epidermal patterning factor-like protein n=1 Tax=Lactuca virosa TaxID=75947 RepID=A0AAU9MGM6_9ASTR|nr:unnamed protein product [Lactuca virosa]